MFSFSSVGLGGGGRRLERDLNLKVIRLIKVIFRGSQKLPWLSKLRFSCFWRGVITFFRGKKVSNFSQFFNWNSHFCQKILKQSTLLKNDVCKNHLFFGRLYSRAFFVLWYIWWDQPVLLASGHMKIRFDTFVTFWIRLWYLNGNREKISLWSSDIIARETHAPNANKQN